MKRTQMCFQKAFLISNLLFVDVFSNSWMWWDRTEGSSPRRRLVGDPEEEEEEEEEGHPEEAAADTDTLRRPAPPLRPARHPRHSTRVRPTPARRRPLPRRRGAPGTCPAAPAHRRNACRPTRKSTSDRRTLPTASCRCRNNSSSTFIRLRRLGKLRPPQTPLRQPRLMRNSSNSSNSNNRPSVAPPATASCSSNNSTGRPRCRHPSRRRPQAVLLPCSRRCNRPPPLRLRTCCCQRGRRGQQRRLLTAPAQTPAEINLRSRPNSSPTKQQLTTTTTTGAAPMTTTTTTTAPAATRPPAASAPAPPTLIPTTTSPTTTTHTMKTKPKKKTRLRSSLESDPIKWSSRPLTRLLSLLPDPEQQQQQQQQAVQRATEKRKKGLSNSTRPNPPVLLLMAVVAPRCVHTWTARGRLRRTLTTDLPLHPGHTRLLQSENKCMLLKKRTRIRGGVTYGTYPLTTTVRILYSCQVYNSH